MGRIFETRKATMFKRWDRMAKAFTRIGKDLAIAVKAGGPSPDTNPTLRRVIQNARAANMPKDRIENAIKKASGQGAESYDIVMYEGYAQHGIAIMVETATNNVVRTVANVRSAFKTYGGSLGAEGSVAFQFKRMGVFRVAPEALAGKDLEALELDLIDHGLEEMGDGTNDKGEPQVIFRGAFTDFGKLQAAIEKQGIPVQSADSEYVPQNLITLPEDKATQVLELVDTLEQDDDVQRVFHNLG
jgi:YebC/PmpR family DNA-binding regulatory protein